MFFWKVYSAFVCLYHVFHFERKYCEVSKLIRFKFTRIVGFIINEIHLCDCLKNSFKKVLFVNVSCILTLDVLDNEK
jgi:hypothetical protein